jgi:hypothetical protein
MRHNSDYQLIAADVVTAKRAAVEVGVGEDSVNKAKRVIRDAAPEVTAAVKAGDLTLHAATQIVKAVPRRDQPSAVARVVEASKDKPRSSPTAQVLSGVDPRRDRAIHNPKHEQFALAVQKLEIGAELITKYVDVASQDTRRREFLNTLREVRTAISRAINQLEIAA